MKQITGSAFIDDWNNVCVSVYVDHNVKFGRDVVEGLRIHTEQPKARQKLQRGTKQWDNAVAAFKRDGNLDAVRARVDVSEEDAKLIEQEAQTDAVS